MKSRGIANFTKHRFSARFTADLQAAVARLSGRIASGISSPNSHLLRGSALPRASCAGEFPASEPRPLDETDNAAANLRSRGSARWRTPLSLRHADCIPNLWNVIGPGACAEFRPLSRKLHEPALQWCQRVRGPTDADETLQPACRSTFSASVLRRPWGDTSRGPSACRRQAASARGRVSHAEPRRSIVLK